MRTASFSRVSERTEKAGSCSDAGVDSREAGGWSGRDGALGCAWEVCCVTWPWI